MRRFLRGRGRNVLRGSRGRRSPRQHRRRSARQHRRRSARQHRRLAAGHRRRSPRTGTGDSRPGTEGKRAGARAEARGRRRTPRGAGGNPGPQADAPGRRRKPGSAAGRPGPQPDARGRGRPGLGGCAPFPPYIGGLRAHPPARGPLRHARRADRHDTAPDLWPRSRARRQGAGVGRLSPRIRWVFRPTPQRRRQLATADTPIVTTLRRPRSPRCLAAQRPQRETDPATGRVRGRGVCALSLAYRGVCAHTPPTPASTRDDGRPNRHDTAQTSLPSVPWPRSAPSAKRRPAARTATRLAPRAPTPTPRSRGAPGAPRATGAASAPGRRRRGGRPRGRRG
ncbi:MAG: hypothetical protein QOI62_389 [Solirubrobacteraceae bacterium]|nr:hypothetical protein [Solirubrobacteraceae bacterium]